MTLCNDWKGIPKFVPLTVFTQIFVSYESVQYKRSAFILEVKRSVTSAYIACATGKWYHSIELTESFLLILNFCKDHS